MTTTTLAATPTVARLPALIKAFDSTLSCHQREQLHHPYSPVLAARWSNLPQAVLGAHRRVGLSTGTLDADGWGALDDLLAAATGSGRGVGLDAIHQHLSAEKLLAARDHHMGYGPETFTIALLDEPGTGILELQFGGHHFALANTYRYGELVGATPSFRGIEPFTPFARDGRVNHPMYRKHTALGALLTGLDDDQQRTARLRLAPDDLLLGPGDDWRFPADNHRLAAVDLTDQQRDLLRDAIASYVGDVEDSAAQTILARYDHELDDTAIAFGGTPSLEKTGDYVRIDGPSVWIELSMRPGINFPFAHPHSVWRDKTTDYGAEGKRERRDSDPLPPA